VNSNRLTYVVRAKPDGRNQEAQFLNGIASIGYPHIGDLKKIVTPERLPTQGEIFGRLRSIEKQLLDSGQMLESDRWINSLAATQIHTFISMPIGSIILTPSLATRAIHLFETISEYFYEPTADNDDQGNPHRLHVKHLKTIERTVLSRELQSLLNAAKKAVTDISRLSDEIIKIAYAKQVSIIQETSQDFAAKADKVLLGLLESNSKEIRKQAALGLLDSSVEEIRLKAALTLRSL
jgi:predicted Mrr-cat superfamily restriction endonuclease